MTDSDVLIDARGLTRRYGQHDAVRDLNLTLRKGEVLGLLGPNGAGKSTTMKMLTGTLKPTAGSVTIKGVSMSESPKQAKQALGYLPEQPPIYGELTVDEFLDFAAGLHGLRGAARRQAVASAKRDCGLDGVSRRLIANLSKGYQQRVGLAQAIIHRPPVIILDEPTVGLDPIQIREIRSLISDLGRNHSVVLSSHILPEIQAVCSRVMIIARGRAVYDEPLTATENAAFDRVRVGLSRPPDLAALRAIDGVRAATTAAGSALITLEVTPGQDPREAIATAAQQGCWGLYELRAVTRSLEDIFVALTSGDAPVAGSTPAQGLEHGVAA
jgi:ABC-2 type transport system ATP-binding protein